MRSPGADVAGFSFSMRSPGADVSARNDELRGEPRFLCSEDHRLGVTRVPGVDLRHTLSPHALRSRAAEDSLIPPSSVARHVDVVQSLEFGLARGAVGSWKTARASRTRTSRRLWKQRSASSAASHCSAETLIAASKIARRNGIRLLRAQAHRCGETRSDSDAANQRSTSLTWTCRRGRAAA